MILKNLFQDFSVSAFSMNVKPNSVLCFRMFSILRWADLEFEAMPDHIRSDAVEGSGSWWTPDTRIRCTWMFCSRSEIHLACLTATEPHDIYPSEQHVINHLPNSTISADMYSESQLFYLSIQILYWRWPHNTTVVKTKCPAIQCASYYRKVGFVYVF